MSATLLDRIKHLEQKYWDSSEEEGRYGDKHLGEQSFSSFLAARDIKDKIKDKQINIIGLKRIERDYWDAFDEERRYGTKESRSRAYGKYLAARDIREEAEKMLEEMQN